MSRRRIEKNICLTAAGRFEAVMTQSKSKVVCKTFDTIEQAREAIAANAEEMKAKRVSANKSARTGYHNQRYDPDTGFVMRGDKRCDRMIRSSKASSTGYRYIGLRLHGKDRRIAAHRFAFFFMNGVWPVGIVDHINGIKDDNRWVNLREVTVAENNANIAHRIRRNVVRLNGKYYPLLTEGFDCPHEAALVADALDQRPEHDPNEYDQRPEEEIAAERASLF